MLASMAILVAGLLAGSSLEASGLPTNATLSLTDTVLVIPQWDYEAAIYYTEEDPYPHVDLAAVDRNTIVDKEHQAVVLENRYVRLVLLPNMGRVYSMVYKPTGNEVFWRNDIVTVGGGQNDTGWWIWIGGAEYTLPGDEHGTTWALPWDWEIVADADARKAVRMQVREPGTGLDQTLLIELEAERAHYRADITVANPTDSTVHYAHWVNPQWTPGGRNELTDSTEFIIPTERILIEERWQKNMGPSPQAWPGNRLRFIRGWDKAGDLMADGLTAGFYSAYAHDEAEGVVRVFDPEDTPGVDIWTYGFHPTRIPMGSGAPNKGYAEMWGGTSRTYPDERKPLAPGASVQWSEWMYPYQRTGGLTFADRELAVNFKVRADGDVAVGICPSGDWAGVAQLWLRDGDDGDGESGGHDDGDGDGDDDGDAVADDRVLRSWSLELRPDRPFHEEVPPTTVGVDPCRQLHLTIQSRGGDEVRRLRPECSPPTSH